MAARSLAVLIALAGTLVWVSTAGAARNGPIAWEHLYRAGPAIVESDTAGGDLRDLVGPAIGPGAGVFSPTGDRLAYAGIGRESLNRVFVAHLLGAGTGTREELLTESRGAGFRISDWSADGSRVLYYYEEDFGHREDIPAEHRLAVVRTDVPGGVTLPILLPRGIVPVAGGSFFPDSRTIAFAARLQLLAGSGLGVLLRANVDGGNPAPIPTDLKLDGVDGVPRDPAVSPDGTKIAYSLDLTPDHRGAADDLASLVVINADGSGRRVLTRGRRDTRPQWSPDGRMLTFQRQTRLSRDCPATSGSCYFEYEIFVIGADGHGEANFSNDPPYNFGPDWRPARPRSVGGLQTGPLVSLLAGGTSLPLAPGRTVPLQVLCPRGPRACAGVATLLAGKREVVRKRFRVRPGASQVLRARVRGRTLNTKVPVKLRLVTKTGNRRPTKQSITLKRRAGLDLACPASGRVGDPLLFRGRLRAPGKARARLLRVHLENEATGTVLDHSVKAAPNGVFGLSAPLPTDGPWSVTLAWTGDKGAFGRAAACRTVVRGPPLVQLVRPTPGATFAADSDIALEGAGSDTIDRTLPATALSWTVDGAPAGTGRSLNARIHALGHHTITLTATNGAGLSGSASVGIEVVRPDSEPTVSIVSPKDGADLPKGPADFTAEASDSYDGRLSGTAITWRDAYTDDLGKAHDDSIGSGEHITAILYSSGTGTAHRITATATNSGGRASSASITVIAH